MAKDVLSYGIGTLVAFVLIGVVIFLFISDITLSLTAIREDLKDTLQES